MPCDIVSGLKDKLNAYFNIEESSKNTLIEDMRSRNAIGVYLRNSAYTAKPKPEAYSSLDGSFASRKLELNVLHKLILERELNIDQEKLRNQTHILYTRDANEAFELVDSGERQIAFFLNNIEVKAVLDIAASGERMPQKATYFYPKLLSGMVFRIMERE